jgi:peptidylprolyl isomerase
MISSMAAPPRLHVAQIPPPADLTRPPEDAVRTPSTKDGRNVLLSKTLAGGTGRAHPRPTDFVTAHYTVWAPDGTTLDDSRSRGAPARWIPGQLWEGLGAGLQLMVVGEKRRFWIPGSIGYEWATDTLVYDIELLAVDPGPPWPTRDEVLTPAPDATRTPSGLRFHVLRAGTGTERPKRASTVTILYTEWSTSGATNYDDAVARNAPLTVAVDSLVPGLAEALQRMVVGEKTRFWIPAELAYPAPIPRAALLVDVELMALQAAAKGRPGTIRIQSNSPDAAYELILPDGTARRLQGPQTVAGAEPGRYRIKPAILRSYATGIVAAPDTMTLAPGATLDITITYAPIIH